MIIDADFKTQLTTAILTVPIVYISDYNYGYVDQALKEILFSENGTHDLLGLKEEQVYEYDFSFGSDVSFVSCNGRDRLGTQTGDDTGDLVEILRQIAGGARFDKKKIFLLKGIAQCLYESRNVSLLMRFASNYELFVGESKLVTVILVDNTPLSLLPPAILPLLYSIEIPLPDAPTILRMIQSIPISKSVPDGDDLRGRLTESLKGLDLYQVGKIFEKGGGS